MNATALSMGVAWRKIFGLVTSRRKLATTIGISVSAAPVADRPIALLEPVARRGMMGMIGCSVREAATSTSTSGVIAKGLEHVLVAQRIHAVHQPTAALEHRQAHPAALGGFACRTKPQLQPFLDQARQARALLGGKRLGIRVR